MNIAVATSMEVLPEQVLNEIFNNGLINFHTAFIRPKDPSFKNAKAGLKKGLIVEREEENLLDGCDELIAFWNVEDRAVARIVGMANALHIPVHLVHLAYDPMDSGKSKQPDRTWAEEQEALFEEACISIGMDPLEISSWKRNHFA